MCVQEFDSDCIREFLDHLTPARARVTHATRLHEQQQRQEGSAASAFDACGLPAPQLTSEPIYGTQYDVQVGGLGAHQPHLTQGRRQRLHVGSFHGRPSS